MRVERGKGRGEVRGEGERGGSEDKEVREDGR